MKNRRIILISFLLVTTLCVGIGYAAVEDELSLSGSAEVGTDNVKEALDGDVYFSNAVVTSFTNTDSDKTDVAEVNSSDNDKVTFEANTLQAQNDTVTFTFTIENESTDLDAIVTPSFNSATNSNDTVFAVSYQWSDGGSDAKTIAAGSTADVVVTVKLLQTPTDAVSGAFTASLIAEYNAGT